MRKIITVLSALYSIFICNLKNVCIENFPFSHSVLMFGEQNSNNIYSIYVEQVHDFVDAINISDYRFLNLFYFTQLVVSRRSILSSACSLTFLNVVIKRILQTCWINLKKLYISLYLKVPNLFVVKNHIGKQHQRFVKKLKMKSFSFFSLVADEAFENSFTRCKRTNRSHT